MNKLNRDKLNIFNAWILKYFEKKIEVNIFVA